MIYNVYCVKDFNADYFMRPIIFRNDGDAIRDFTTIVNTPGNLINSFPKDFALYKIGTFDDSVGALEHTEFKCIASGHGVVLEKPTAKSEVNSDVE